MKGFFSKYSYDVIKMFVNQFAISIFGSMLAMATSFAGNDVLTLVVSIFAIIFYLFLIYTMTWEIGAKDKISVDVGKKDYKPMTGLYLALLANIPNFLIAGLYTVAYPTMSTAAWAGGIAAFASIASLILQGMYRGVMMTVYVGATPLMNLWWTYFLIMVPSLFMTWLAYFLGHKNFRFFAFITQKSNDNK